MVLPVLRGLLNERQRELSENPSNPGSDNLEPVYSRNRITNSRVERERPVQAKLSARLGM
jgi:hypothetical protein